MAKRRPEWFVSSDAAAARYAFFISHVGEDAAEVKELKAEIQALSGKGGRTPIDCFLDRHDWPGGNNNTAVMRDHLLQSRHMVLWVTPGYLQSRRGWVWMELAYAELLELSFNFGQFGRRYPYIVPVFRGVTVEQTDRTPLVDYWSVKLAPPDAAFSIREVAAKLVDFHEQEARKRGEVGG